MRKPRLHERRAEKRVLRLLALIGPLVMVPFLAAGDDQRGVLPDGRAFRTDAEGNVLVDYIAELEMSVETLTSKVHGLEDELKVKERQLETARKGTGDVELVKQDLFAPSSGASQKGKVIATGKLGGERKECPVCAPPVCPAVPTPIRCPTAPDCSNEIERYEERLSETTARLEEVSEEKEEVISELREELAEAQETVSRQKEKVNEQETQLATLREQLTDVEEGKETLERQSAALQRQVAQAQAQTVAARQQAESVRQGSARQSGTSAGVIYEPSPGRAPSDSELGRARTLALSSIKGKLRTSLNEVSGLIAKRDNAFKEYARSKRTVSVKPRKVVAASGLTFPQVRARLEQAASMRELAELQRDISAMRSLLQEDIALIQRVR